jgi:signal transduction histidine kinase
MVNPFGKIGLRLLRWFLLAALIPLLFMGYQGYYFGRRAVEREVFLHMQAVARSKRLTIEQWFQERMTDMRALGNDPFLVASCSALENRPDPARLEGLHRRLSSYQRESRPFVKIALFDRRDTLILQVGDGLIPRSSTPFRGQALALSDPELGSIYANPVHGPSIEIAYAVRDTLGQAVAVLEATLALSHTLNPIILDATGLGQTGQAYLLDTNRVMLTPSRFMNHPQPLTHTMDSKGIRRALEGTSGAGVYTGFNGQPVIGAWDYLYRQKWALIAEMDAAEAFAPLAVLRRNTILVAVLTFAGITVLVALISRSISRPIRQLAEASLDVSRGNLDRRVSVTLRDEVGALAERFNLMVQSLKESRRQLVQSERLAAIGELVASVVHEIRNPLSAVKMNLRILENRCPQDPLAAEHFQIARAQTERLEAMLEDLLDYSKPVSLNRQHITLGEIIADARRSFETACGDAGITLDIRLDDPQVALEGDRARLSQVFLNLFLNSRQAMPSGGRITINGSKRRTERGWAVVIVISDNGNGVSEEHVKHVFEPFFTTRKQGTGLGLSNTRKIVEAHGGAISLESRLHEGTTVTITLPAGA